MGKELREDNRRDGWMSRCASKAKSVMSSNLPLLMAKGRPRSLDTISQNELEDFVPFMILCSLGQEQHKRPFKDINNCKIPEWWPQGFPFKYPLMEQSHWTDRQVMLKSLVCRCYTYYNCEFLLKFSSQLAEMPPSHVRFQQNKNDNTTSIYDVNNSLLVKCRNENLSYDIHKNHKRFLAPSPNRPTLGSSKKFFPLIDLTFETSSEDEKEVYFKEQTAPPAPVKNWAKRKPSCELSEEPTAKQRCLRRTFDDFPKEEPEPEVYDEEQFMMKFGLVRAGKEIAPVEPKHEPNLPKERKQRLARCFNLLSVTCGRGQQLLKKNRNSVNVEACLERIERFTSTAPEDEMSSALSDQVATRASLNYGYISPVSNTQEGAEQKWCHSFKWPHRTKKVSYLHRGPSIKPCSVKLVKLSQEELASWDRSKQTKATSTPPVWWLHNRPICQCLKIPLITLDDDSTETQRDKGTSTRCTCTVPQMPKLFPISQHQSPPRLFNNSRVKPTPPTLIEINPEVSSFSPRSTRIITPSSSDGPTLTQFNAYQASPPVNFKRAMHRRPLAVVSPSTVEPSDSVFLGSPLSLSLSFFKISFYKSILDAIKWYTKEDDPVITSVDLAVDHHAEIKGFAKVRVNTQENIQPLSQMVDLKTIKISKVINYFKKTIDTTNRDSCYTNSPEDVQSKMMTRRGIRLCSNREPCPSCFQGQYNICVYEFIRQAKLAGVPLHRNEKQLQQMFFEFVQSLSNQL